jgi:RimJ/RimL family protein N-acetyltransferase
LSGPTPDIALRPWASGDLGLLERLLGDPAMTEHLGGPESADQIARRHGRYLAMADPTAGAMFAVVDVGSGTAVGSVGYWEHDNEGTPVWETGWSVLPEFQGRGIATAATRLAIEAAWATVARPVHAYPGVANAASNAIARKAGFHLLGPREFEYPKGHQMSCNDWVIEPPGWVARQPRPG